MQCSLILSTKKDDGNRIITWAASQVRLMFESSPRTLQTKLLCQLVRIRIEQILISIHGDGRRPGVCSEMPSKK